MLSHQTEPQDVTRETALAVLAALQAILSVSEKLGITQWTHFVTLLRNWTFLCTIPEETEPL